MEGVNGVSRVSIHGLGLRPVVRLMVRGSGRGLTLRPFSGLFWEEWQTIHRPHLGSIGHTTVHRWCPSVAPATTKICILADGPWTNRQSLMEGVNGVSRVSIHGLGLRPMADGPWTDRRSVMEGVNGVSRVSFHGLGLRPVVRPMVHGSDRGLTLRPFIGLFWEGWQAIHRPHLGIRHVMIVMSRSLSASVIILRFRARTHVISFSLFDHEDCQGLQEVVACHSDAWGEKEPYFGWCARHTPGCSNESWGFDSRCSCSGGPAQVVPAPAIGAQIAPEVILIAVDQQCYERDTSVEPPPMDFVPVVREFEPGTKPISIDPNCMAPVELKELKDQWYDLFSKEFIHLSVSPRGASLFSNIYLSSAYHLLKIRASNILKTASGLVIVFIDDILVYSKTEEDHDQYLRIVLQRLREEKLYFKFSKLTRKCVSFDECEEIFLKLKTFLTSAPVLTLPKEGANITVYCDASRVELGVILMQKGKRDLNLRQHRLLELLKDYDTTILYHMGKANVVVDVLSKKISRMESLSAISVEERTLARYVQRLAKSLFDDEKLCLIREKMMRGEAKVVVLDSDGILQIGGEICVPNGVESAVSPQCGATFWPLVEQVRNAEPLFGHWWSRSAMRSHSLHEQLQATLAACLAKGWGPPRKP
ncbi:hypothetical protein MTR67_007327 [Solanum verrucosum]|uniref:Polyprotein n=1 Tax=Solanum verrucosum TaxID=315347 RepID=A0AAF0TAI2_SOLVR|nr:hypothetical protein MTR67_007327 [Solanum verrucosum]